MILAIVVVIAMLLLIAAVRFREGFGSVPHQSPFKFLINGGSAASASKEPSGSAHDANSDPRRTGQQKSLGAVRKPTQTCTLNAQSPLGSARHIDDCMPMIARAPSSMRFYTHRNGQCFAARENPAGCGLTPRRAGPTYKVRVV